MYEKYHQKKCGMSHACDTRRTVVNEQGLIHIHEDNYLDSLLLGKMKIITPLRA
jgi:hypothetical protein